MAADLVEYYRRRAPEYESIYFRPDAERLFQLEELARALRGWLAGRDVLEVATGTGWWTVHAAAVAQSVTATDINQETMAIAQMKPLDQVRFVIADAYKLEEIPGRFNGFLANYWLSHVPRARIPEFLEGVHHRLEPGSRVFMADNAYTEDFGGQFIQEPGSEDTYRLRTWKDGSQHKVLKNYYSEAQFREMLIGMEDLQIHVGPCYWWVMYETPVD